MSSDSDQALDELRRRLTDPTGHEERRARYWAAIRRDTTSRSKVDAVLRLVDAELAIQRADRESADRKAVERAVDLCEVWAFTDPDGIMSRSRAAQTLWEVLDQ